MQIDPSSECSTDQTRRRLLQFGGSVFTIGTLGVSSASATTSPTTSGGDIEVKPDFDGYLSGADGGYEDARGENTITVSVDAEGNGGNVAFSPAGIWIDPGTTVIWEWNGEGGAHGVESVEGPADFRSSVESNSNYTFEFQFTESHTGITKYRCISHEALGQIGAVAVGEEIPTQTSRSPEWTFETDDGIYASSPTVGDGTVFIGSGDNHLYAVDTDTGTQQWSFETNDGVYSSPALAAGTVFIGSSDGNLYAVDAESGNTEWTFETGDAIHSSSPTVGDGTVFIGSGDNHIYAVDAESGNDQWSFTADNNISSSPTVVGGIVYAGSFDTNLYAVDVETGDQQWRFETDGRIQSSPTVMNGSVFVGSNDENLYAVDVETGDQQWRFETDARIESSPTVADGTVYVGSHDDNLYAVDAESGEQQWSFETVGRVLSSPTVADGNVFFGDGLDLYSVDAESGAKQWNSEIGADVESPTVVNGTVYVGSGNGNLYAFEADIEGSSEGSRVQHGTLGYYGGDTAENGSEMTQNQENETSTSVPGFTITGSLAAIGGIGYLIERRVKTDQTEK